MGQVKQSRAQLQHREWFKKWMGADNRNLMTRSRLDWMKDHQDYLRRLEVDMFEQRKYGLRVLG